MPKFGSHIVKYFQHTCECNTHSRPHSALCEWGRHPKPIGRHTFSGGWCLALLVWVDPLKITGEPDLTASHQAAVYVAPNSSLNKCH